MAFKLSKFAQIRCLEGLFPDTTVGLGRLRRTQLWSVNVFIEGVIKKVAKLQAPFSLKV